MSARSKEFLAERATAMYRAALLESCIEKGLCGEAEDEIHRLKKHISKMKALGGGAP